MSLALVRFLYGNQTPCWGLLASVVLTLLMTSAEARPVPQANTNKAQPFKKVFIIVLENTTAAAALQQPYLSALRQRGATLNQFFAVSHPSQPNYIALTSASTQGVSDNHNVDLDVKHIGDLLEAKDKSWRQYAEGYPEQCFTGALRGRYVRKHAPFISYRNVQSQPTRCANLVNAAQLEQDIAQGKLADYSLYIPDLDNDGHDTNVAFADHWLQQTFESRFNNPRFMRDMLVVITFDEDDYSRDNRVYTVLLGNGVKAGAISEQRYNFYSLLKTIEYTLGLGTLGKEDDSATVINDIWR